MMSWMTSALGILGALWLSPAIALAEDDPIRFDLGAGTAVPFSLDVGAVVELPGRVRIGGTVWLLR